MEEILPAPEHFEEGSRPVVEPLKKVNLGTPEDPRPVFIGAGLSLHESEELTARDVFAWSDNEMPGLDPTLVMHRLAVSPEMRPVVQSQRRYHPDVAQK